MVVSALLAIIIWWILVAFYFWYFGQSLDKHNVDKTITKLKSNLTDLASQVRYWNRITVNNSSVIKKLQTEYTNKTIVLKKWMTVENAFLPNTNLSGTKLETVPNNLKKWVKYLVLESNANFNDTWVVLWETGINNYFSANNNNANQAGLTYRGVYFLMNASNKPTFDKIASANIGRMNVLPEAAINNGTGAGAVSVNTILVQLSNVWGQ